MKTRGPQVKVKAPQAGKKSMLIDDDMELIETLSLDELREFIGIQMDRTRRLSTHVIQELGFEAPANLSLN